jgi:nicotinamide-nucleotide amidase
MNAEIVAVGSELVSGQKLDTNSQWLSRRLGELGVEARFHTAVGDDLAANVEVFRIASERADLVVVSGGLGPTQDDLTREALAALAEVPLEEHLESLRALEAFFARRNRSMPARNRVQALLPAGAEPLPNRTGTAPGVLLDVGRALFACLPGVPSELKIVFDEEVVPRLRATGRLRPGVIVHRVVNLFGKGESEIEAEALDLTARGRRPEVGITASDATISLRVSCEAPSVAEAEAAIAPTLALIRERFGRLIVGEGEVDVTEAVVEGLERTGSTIAVAESCTGGLIAQRLTSVAGVSPYFPGGVVTYANEAKTDLVGVPAELIAAHGAVSAEVAEAMAEGVRRRFGTTLGLGVTGIAGPSGGSPQKPVGLVYLGLATPEGVAHRKLELGPEQPREVIRSRAAKHALNWARLALLDREIS